MDPCLRRDDGSSTSRLKSLFQQRRHRRVGLVGLHNLGGEGTLVEPVVEKDN
jgi:hypothetical protein